MLSLGPLYLLKGARCHSLFCVSCCVQIDVHLKQSAFEAQHLSLIAWALACLECKPTVLLDAIEEQVLLGDRRPARYERQITALHLLKRCVMRRPAHDQSPSLVSVSNQSLLHCRP